mgnify:CR=1 FL=1
MTSLFVTDDNDTTHSLDLYDEIVPKLTKQFVDINTLGTNTSSFTKTFRIPATPTNAALFGPLHDPGATFVDTGTKTYETRKKKAAVLEVDTIPVFNGYLRLVKIVTQKGKHYEYEVNLFGETSTLAKDLGDSKLTDCTKLGDLDHVLNYANVTGSWDGSLESGDVVYGFIDYGARFGTNEGAFRDISDAANALDPDHFKPCVRVKAVVDAIMEQAGWTWESDWYTADSDWDDMFIPWVNHADAKMQLPEGSDPTASKLIWIGVPTDQTLSLSAGASSSLITSGNYDESTAPYFDAGSNVTAAGVYTPPSDGVYAVTANIAVKQTTAGSPYSLNIALIDTTTGDIVRQEDGSFAFSLIYPPLDGSVGVSTLNWAVDLDTSDTVQLQVGAPMGGDITIQGASGGGAAGDPDVTWWRITDAPATALGATVPMQAAAPDAKCVDVLSDLGKLFNLVFIPDETKKNHIKIEPFADYVGSGSDRDWTTKLDLGKDYYLQPAAEFQKKELILTYQKDDDHYHGQVRGAARTDGERIYGEKVIDNSGNDFATDEQKIETKVFASTPSAQVWGSIMVCPKFFDTEGAPIKPKPRILFFQKTTAGAGAVWYMNNGATATAQTDFAYMGEFETFNSGLSDRCLSYGVETPFHYVAHTTYNSLFYDYWQQFLAETYSEDGRVLTGYFRLTLEDIYNAAFNDTIYCLGQEWRINKIDGYGVGVDEPVKVELIKIEKAQRCQFLPSTVSAAGVVTMVDADGTTSAGNQECCELFGYTWDGSQCLDREKVDLGNTPTAGIPIDPGGTGGGVIYSPDTDPSMNRFAGSKPTAGTENVQDSMFIGGSTHKVGGTYSTLGYGGNLMLGRNGMLVHDGELIHGGGADLVNDADPTAEIAGRAQFMEVMMMGEGVINGGDVTLRVMGRSDNYDLEIQDDCTWYMIVDLAIIHVDASTGATTGHEVMRYDTYIFNDNGSITGQGNVTKTYGAGTYSCYKLHTSVVGGRVRLKVNLGTCNHQTTDPSHITARVKIIQSRNRDA